MKRARNKKTTADNSDKKPLSGYSSEMNELGYDPDTFAESEGDVSAKPDTFSKPEEAISASPDAMENDSEPESDQPREKFETGKTDQVLDDDEDFEDYEEKPRSKNHKKLLIFSVSLATIIVIFFAFLGLGGVFNPHNEIDQDYVVPVDKATGKMNVLILGVDKDGLRTDTMIVACYDLDDKKVNMLSIPRDTRMYIGNRYQKINAAHAISQSGKIKGPQGSIEAVTRLTGIPINYYVEFSFDAFKNMIDALDGVNFDVPRDMNYEDPTQALYIHLNKGYQLLDGDKAEQLVRFRRYPEGDIARVQMQQAFIKAVADQKLNMSIVNKLPDLYNVLKSDINTNFTLLDMSKYINNLSELSAENIVMHQLPGKFSGGEYTASYWIPDMDAIKTMVENDFELNASKATMDSEDNSSLSKKDADKIKTPSPSTKSKNTETKKSTHSASTSNPSATTKSTSAPSKTLKPTAKPKTQDEPQSTEKATEKPVEKTQKPSPTESPTEQATTRPARPTPNTTQNTED